MDKWELLERIKKARRSQRPDDMPALMDKFGFSRRVGRKGHWVYSHSRLDYMVTITPDNPLLPKYVSMCIRAIEESHGGGHE